MAEPSGRNFVANYPGKCSGCGERFEPGDLIKYYDGQLYAEDGCLEGGRPSARGVDLSPLRRPACPRCFTEPSANGTCLCG